MDIQERLLYQQIHPIKITVDVLSAVTALGLLWWSHDPTIIIIAIAIMLIPPALATMIILRTNLESLKQSALGQYLRTYITRSVEWARSAGLGVMAVGAWFHMIPVILVGALIIAGAWFSGVIFPNPES